MKTYRNRMTDMTGLDAGMNQRGIALVFALVVLVILTILGVSALRTSSLEQLMSGNTQELTRAFEAADSGLAKSLNGMPTDLTSFVNNTSYSYSSMNASATAKTPTLLQIGPPVRSDKPTDNSIGQAYYDQQVTGATTLTNAKSVLHQGLNTGAPMNPYSP